MRSFSIGEWCELHGFSRSFFYKLASQGEAPKSFKVGRVTRISWDANREWVAAREALAAASANDVVLVDERGRPIADGQGRFIVTARHKCTEKDAA